VSPDGKTLYSGGKGERELFQWNLDDPAASEPTRKLEGHTSRINSLCMSTDGTRVVSGSYDTTIRVWNVETGGCIHTLEGHNDSVKSVALSLDGTWIASGSGSYSENSDNTVRIWNAASGECTGTFKGHTKKINSVVISFDGTHVFSSSDDGTLKVWVLETGVCEDTVDFVGVSVQDLAVLDEDRLVCGVGNCVVVLNTKRLDLVINQGLLVKAFLLDARDDKEHSGPDFSWPHVSAVLEVLDGNGVMELLTADLSIYQVGDPAWAKITEKIPSGHVTMLMAASADGSLSFLRKFLAHHPDMAFATASGAPPPMNTAVALKQETCAESIASVWATEMLKVGDAGAGRLVATIDVDDLRKLADAFPAVTFRFLNQLVPVKAGLVVQGNLTSCAFKDNEHHVRGAGDRAPEVGEYDKRSFWQLADLPPGDTPFEAFVIPIKNILSPAFLGACTRCCDARNDAALFENRAVAYVVQHKWESFARFAYNCESVVYAVLMAANYALILALQGVYVTHLSTQGPAATTVALSAVFFAREVLELCVSKVDVEDLEERKHFDSYSDFFEVLFAPRGRLWSVLIAPDRISENGFVWVVYFLLIVLPLLLLSLPLLAIGYPLSSPRLWNSTPGRQLRQHATDPWNWLVLVTHVMVIAGGVRALQDPDAAATRLLVGGAQLPLYLNALWYFRARKGIGQLIQMILTILVDIRGLIFVMFLLIVPFSLFFFVGSDIPSGRADTTPDWVHEDYNGYRTIALSLLTTFRGALGDFDFADLQQADSFTMMNVYAALLLFLVTIVILNLLIAIMGDSYEKVKEVENGVFTRERAKIVMQYEQLLLAVGMKRLVFGQDGDKTREDHAPWLHILRPASYDEDDDRDTEWRGVSGKIGDVDDKVEGLEEQLTALLDQNMNGKVEGLEKQMASLDQKMDDKIGTLEQKIDSKIGTLDQKMDTKIDALDQKISSLDQKMDSILLLLQK
jgi:hypothetical protein